MRKPAISVIMSEYNTVPEYLDASIKSILSQTYKDFEFIIIDDCGSNNVAEFVKKYNDKRIQVYRNKQNMGLVYSLNEAITRASGEYLVRMDGDDIAQPQRIDTLRRFMIEHPEYSVVGSKVIEFSESGKHGMIGKSGEKTTRSIMRGDIIIHPSAIMRREVIIGIGGYKNIKRAEDLVLWCDLLLEGNRIYAIADPLLHYRVNAKDYKKRTIAKRKYEIKARMSYYPRMGANALDYLYILKSIVSGILPTPIVRAYRNRFVVVGHSNTTEGTYDE